MKIRNGFVSNSSSSSFVVVTKTYWGLDQITEEDVKNKEIWTVANTDDNDDYFRLDVMMFRKIKDRRTDVTFSDFYEVVKMINEDDQEEAYTLEVPKGYKVRIWDRTYHYTRDYADFKGRYISSPWEDDK
jgi:hypothetical protein